METNENVGSYSGQSGSSFLIRIQYRQNASWQGMIQWLDGKKSRHFRSFLEMVMLMQEALSHCEKSGDTMKFQKWEEKDEVS